MPDTLLSTAKNSGKAIHEGWRVRKDGTRFWGNIVITAIHDDTGEIAGYLKVTRDFTERKKAEDNYSNYVEELKSKNEALKQSEERYHKMVSEVADYVIILLDKTGKVLDWNKGAERIKGYKSEEILGKSFRLFYPREDRSQVRSLLKRAGETAQQPMRDGNSKDDEVLGSVLFTPCTATMATSSVSRSNARPYDKKIR